MNEAGCARGTRNAKQVLDKIGTLEQSFRKAHDWAEGQTGSGLKETDEGSFNEYCKKLCKNYFDLLPIMKSRAGAKAMATTEEIENDTDTLSMASSENASIESIPDDTGSDDAAKDTADDGGVLGDTVGVAARMNKSSRKKDKSTKKSKSVVRAKGQVDIGIESSVASLQRMKDKEITEMKRHNLAMEEIESKRQKSSDGVDKWKSKQEQLAYMSSLESKFESLKDKGWSDDKILKVYPDMKPFIDDE